MNILEGWETSLDMLQAQTHFCTTQGSRFTSKTLCIMGHQILRHQIVLNLFNKAAQYMNKAKE